MPGAVHPRPSRPGSTLQRLGNAAAWAVMVLIAWQALSSVVDIVSDLGRRPRAKHLQALRASPEELIHLTLGRDFEIWQALQRHVPPGSQVLLARSIEGAGVKSLLTKLYALSYPTTFRARPYPPVPPRSEAARRFEWRGYLLELGPAADFPDIPEAKELARGKRFHLLFFEGQAQ